MIRRGIAVAGMALTLVGCVRRVQEPTRMRSLAGRPQARYGVTESMQRQVRNAVDAGEGDARIRALRQQVAARPDDLASRLELARLYASSGFPEIAVDHYRLAAIRFPESAEVAVGLTKTLAQMGLVSDAKAGIEAFVAGRPNASWQAWSWLGILQDRVREHGTAESSHRAALKLNPSSDALHNNLGQNLLLRGEYRGAAEEFRAALKANPSSMIARNNLAIALAGEPKQAVTEWESVLDRASAHNNLAVVLIERGEYDGARQELTRALEYRKDHPAALRNLQLIAELEGKSSSGQQEAVRTSWQRFVKGLAEVFFGADTESGKNK